MKKLTKKQLEIIAASIIAILAALGIITSCTNSLFVQKGRNIIKTESKMKNDSINIKTDLK